MSDGRPSRTSDQFALRLPDGMRDRIKAAAEVNNRSMNAEIVATLELAYPPPKEEHPVIKELNLVYELMNWIQQAESDQRQEERLVAANNQLASNGAKLRLRISDQRDTQGAREIFMTVDDSELSLTQLSKFI